jgi:hypothetical protein
VRGARRSRTPSGPVSRMWREGRFGRLRLSAECGECSGLAPRIKSRASAGRSPASCRRASRSIPVPPGVKPAAGRSSLTEAHLSCRPCRGASPDPSQGRVDPPFAKSDKCPFLGPLVLTGRLGAITTSGGWSGGPDRCTLVVRRGVDATNAGVAVRTPESSPRLKAPVHDRQPCRFAGQRRELRKGRPRRPPFFHL